MRDDFQIDLSFPTVGFFLISALFQKVCVFVSLFSSIALCADANVLSSSLLQWTIRVLRQGGSRRFC